MATARVKNMMIPFWIPIDYVEWKKAGRVRSAESIANPNQSGVFTTELKNKAVGLGWSIEK